MLERGASSHVLAGVVKGYLHRPRAGKRVDVAKIGLPFLNDGSLFIAARPVGSAKHTEQHQKRREPCCLRKKQGNHESSFEVLKSNRTFLLSSNACEQECQPFSTISRDSLKCVRHKSHPTR